MVNSDSWQDVEIGDQEIRPVSDSAFAKILKSYISSGLGDKDDLFGTFTDATYSTLYRIADLADPDGWDTDDPDPDHWIYVIRLYKATSNKENLKNWFKAEFEEDDDMENIWDIGEECFYKNVQSFMEDIEYDVVIKILNICWSRSCETNDPNDAVGYFNRGNDKYKLGDYQKAIEDLNKAIELNPNLAEAYVTRGATKVNLGDYQGAIGDLNKAIELKPEFAFAYSNRGNAKNKLGDYRKAIEDLNKAIELNPDYANAYYNRGIANNELYEYRSAIKDYNKAIEINPDFAFAYSNRGIAKRNLGDMKGACADWRKASSLGEKNAASWVEKEC